MGAWGIDRQWARMLAYITGLVDQELLVRTEYLAAENRILRAQLKGRLRLLDAERATLGEIGHRLGRKALAEVANAALPDTILGWYQKLVARKFDGSKARRGAGRPRTDSELERVVPYAKNPRVISSAAIEKVASSIKQFGFRQPIVSP